MSETYDLSPEALDRAEALLLEPEEPRADAAVAERVYRDALTCLEDAGVRFCLLRDDIEDVQLLADLDILIAPGDRKIARAALQRAGFQHKIDHRLRGKAVFVRFESGRFYTLDVHAACVQGGIEYMDVRLALSRLDTSGPVPRLCPEDRFVHLLMHNLLGKPELQPKHARLLRALHRDQLDVARLEKQTTPFGTAEAVAHALAHLNELEGDARAWRVLRARTRRILLRRPANVFGMLRYRHADRLRLHRRAVVLALLGPDGTGKTSFADALEMLLRDSPLRAGRVYMGCWGHDLLPMRQARRLIPPQISYVRLLARRCGMSVSITDEESEILVTRRPRKLTLAWAALRYSTKGALFHILLGIEMMYRYVRYIWMSRRPIVITDRYIYDLEFRQGRNPFPHGKSARRLLYRLFPPPDGVLYLSAPYDVVAQRKPQLSREQFELMDRIFQQVLRRQRPLQITPDAPPVELAGAFLTRHWQDVLARCNQRA